MQNKTILYPFTFLLLVSFTIAASCLSIPTEDCTVDGNLTLDFGTYYLNDTGGDGAIIIGANDVTLDCNGATIANGGYSGGIGIYSYNDANVTIKNCNVDGMGEMTDWTNTANWTDMGSNIWKFSDSTVPKRVFLNNTEYGMAQYNATINSSLRWFANSTSGFSVYATSNPAIAYNSIKEPQYSSAMYLNLAKNFTLDNVNLTGANAQALFAWSMANTTVKNSYIGLNSYVGVKMGEGNSGRNSTNNLFDNVTFDSGHKITNSWNVDGVGVSDGIRLVDGSHNNTFKNSFFYDWGQGEEAAKEEIEPDKKSDYLLMFLGLLVVVGLFSQMGKGPEKKKRLPVVDEEEEDEP